MSGVVSLAAWKQQRAARLATRSGHPSATGGPHRDLLAYIAAELAPRGYYYGLWQARGGRVAHAASECVCADVHVTRCGIEVPRGHLRRADRSLPPCRRCFPS